MVAMLLSGIIMRFHIGAKKGDKVVAKLLRGIIMRF